MAEARDEHGKWLPGHCPNPSGGPKGMFSHQALQAIASDFLENYTADDLVALYNDKDQRGKLTTAQAMVLVRITSAMKQEGGRDFDRVLDRLVGKPAAANGVSASPP